MRCRVSLFRTIRGIAIAVRLLAPSVNDLRACNLHRYVESLKGTVQLEYLPAYAPELNPPEHICGHLKHQELGNFLCMQHRGAHPPQAQSPALDAAPLDSRHRVLVASGIAPLKL